MLIRAFSYLKLRLPVVRVMKMKNCRIGAGIETEVKRISFAEKKISHESIHARVHLSVYAIERIRGTTFYARWHLLLFFQSFSHRVLNWFCRWYPREVSNRRGPTFHKTHVRLKNFRVNLFILHATELFPRIKVSILGVFFVQWRRKGWLWAKIIFQFRIHLFLSLAVPGRYKYFAPFTAPASASKMFFVFRFFPAHKTCAQLSCWVILKTNINRLANRLASLRILLFVGIHGRMILVIVKYSYNNTVRGLLQWREAKNTVRLKIVSCTCIFFTSALCQLKGRAGGSVGVENDAARVLFEIYI